MSFGDFEFDGLRDMRQRLERMGASYPRFVEDCIKELAGRLLAKTVARTPVDTGHLRRSWQIGDIHITGTGAEVEVINTADYAMYVEYGHRTRSHTGWVEGRFMLTISIEELERELPAILDRKLEQFIKRHMGW